MGAPTPVPIVVSSVSADQTSLSAFETSLSAFETSLSAFETSLSAFETSFSASETSFSVFETSLSVLETSPYFFETSIPTPTELPSTFSLMRPLWQPFLLQTTRTICRPVGDCCAYNSHVMEAIATSHYTTDQETKPKAIIRPRYGYNSHMLYADVADRKFHYGTRGGPEPLVENLVEPSDERQRESEISVELLEKRYTHDDFDKPKQSEDEADLSEAQIHKLWTRCKYDGTHKFREATSNSRKKRFFGIADPTGIFKRSALSFKPNPPYSWYYGPDNDYVRSSSAKQSEKESDYKENFEKRDTSSSHRSPTIHPSIGPDGDVALPRLSKRFERELGDDEDLDKRDASRRRRKPPYVSYYGPFDSRYIRRRPTKRFEEETDHDDDVDLRNMDYHDVHPRLSKHFEWELGDDGDLDKRDIIRPHGKPSIIYTGDYDLFAHLFVRPTKRSEQETDHADHADDVDLRNHDYHNFHPRLSKRFERELGDDDDLDKSDASQRRGKPPPYVGCYIPFDSRYIRRRPTKRSEANGCDLNDVKCNPNHD